MTDMPTAGRTPDHGPVPIESPRPSLRPDALARALLRQPRRLREVFEAVHPDG